MLFKFSKSSQLVAVVLLVSFHLSHAWAQPNVTSEVQPKREPVELVYQSPFQNYQRYAAPVIRSWRQPNGTVKDIAGSSAYAKETASDQDEQPAAHAHSHGAH